MAKMQEITCKCGCGKKKEVRVSDVKRGWGKFYSKSCKAKWQERRNGQHKAFLQGRGVSNLHPERLGLYIPYELYEDPHPFSSEALGQDQEF